MAGWHHRLDGCEVLFHYSFNFHFVITKEVDCFFMLLVAIGYFLWESACSGLLSIFKLDCLFLCC